MSLALLAEVGGKGGEIRIAAAVGLLMTAALLLASVEQFQADGPAGHWWLPLGCAFASACWCFASCRRSARRQSVCLQVADDGRPRLLLPDGGEVVEARLLGGWILGGLICLRLGPASKVDPVSPATDRGQSASLASLADSRFLLARRSCDEVQWHALRRWLVWQRRSRRSEAVDS